MPSSIEETIVTLSSKQSGQALVEFALVLLFVILPLTFVLVDSAVTLYSYAMLTNAAREGARAVSIYQTPTSPSSGVTCPDLVNTIDSQREAYADQQMHFLLGTLVAWPQCSTNVTYHPRFVCTEQGAPSPNPYRELDALTVQVDCPRRLFFGLIGTSQITLSAQSTMRIEPGGVATGATGP